MNLRPATEGDAEAVLALVRETPTLPQWGRGSLGTSAEADGSAGVLRRLVVAEEDSALVGFAQFSLVLGEAELESIAVRATLRGRGLGRRLLREVMAAVRSLDGTVLRLEVRAGNAAAIGLYRSEGFLPAGTRTGYYREPIEDALLLEYALSS